MSTQTQVFAKVVADALHAIAGSLSDYLNQRDIEGPVTAAELLKVLEAPVPEPRPTFATGTSSITTAKGVKSRATSGKKKGKCEFIISKGPRQGSSCDKECIFRDDYNKFFCSNHFSKVQKDGVGVSSGKKSNQEDKHRDTEQEMEKITGKPVNGLPGAIVEENTQAIIITKKDEDGKKYRICIGVVEDDKIVDADSDVVEYLSSKFGVTYVPEERSNYQEDKQGEKQKPKTPPRPKIPALKI